jgi:predicted O-linked N-acetylglucosamine transferase (SPINDLY family)
MTKKNRPAVPRTGRQQAVNMGGSASAELASFNECVALYHGGKLVEALELAERALEKKSKSAVLLNVAAASAKALGDIEKAERYWRAAIVVKPDWPDIYSNLGNLLRESNRYDEAEKAYRQALKINPDHAFSYNNLGTLLEATSRLSDSETAYRKALAIQPDFVEAWVNLGRVLGSGGRTSDAEDAYRRALQLQPASADAYAALAALLQATQRIDEAEAAYRRALEIRPDSINFNLNLGGLLQALRRFDDAEIVYRNMLAINPNVAEAYNNLSMLLKDTRRLPEAEVACRRALEIFPDYAGAYNNLGILLNDTRRFEESEQAYHHALRLQPDYMNAYNNLGTLLTSMKRPEEAETVFRKALAVNPNFPEVLSNFGNLLHGLQRFDEAEDCFRRAVAANPGYYEAHNNLATLLQEAKKFDLAEPAFREALRLKPDYGNAAGQAFQCAKALCDWSRREEDEARLIGMVQNGTTGVPVFNVLSIAEPQVKSAPLFLRQAAEVFARGKYFELSLPPLVAPARHLTRDRLRIGYLSADFHEHATMYLLQGVLATHDRSRFAIHGYSYGPTSDTVTLKAKENFDVFHDLKRLSGHAAASVIAADDIDILVDLKGYTGHARLEITALRPAPVIVNWLGYPGTLGYERLADYLIGDPIVTPLEHAGNFSETLALMPHCYQPNDRQRAIGSRPRRSEVGLPEAGFVFCSFNQSYKFDPNTFDIWCRLITAVPGSVLWLLAPTSTAMSNLRREARSRGVSPDRLIFGPPLKLAEHLGRLQLADLALDTYPVTSHTTASDVLWAGVPLITRIGDSFVSRVAASLLHSLDLAELVTGNLDEYFDLAKSLAIDPDRLQEIRTKLAECRLTSPLFDTERFTKDLERIYLKIWEQHAAGGRAAISLEEAPPLVSVLGDVTGVQPVVPIQAVPDCLNLIGGSDWRDDCVNVDVVKRLKSDWQVDICRPLPFGDVICTDRFGNFSLKVGCFGLIRANNVMELLPDLVGAMTSCLALLREGGEMHISVPYDLSCAAARDPACVRSFNEESWIYFTALHARVGWEAEYFHLQSQEFVLSSLGNELAAKGVPDEEIHRTPRAVDSLRTVLRKVIGSEK